METKTRLNSSLIGALFLLVVSLFANQMTADPQVPQTEFVANEFTSGDLRIFDSKKDVFLQIGMSEEDIAALYGEPSETDMFGNSVYEGLRVFYRDHKAVKFIFSTSDNWTNRYQTFRQIGLGNTLEEVLAQYGEEHADIHDLYGSTEITYTIKKNGPNFETKNEEDPWWSREDRENIFVIDFLCDDNVSLITIGDLDSVQLNS